MVPLVVLLIVLDVSPPLVLLEVLVLELPQLVLLPHLLLVLAMLMRQSLPMAMLGGCGVLGFRTL